MADVEHVQAMPAAMVARGARLYEAIVDRLEEGKQQAYPAEGMSAVRNFADDARAVKAVYGDFLDALAADDAALAGRLLGHLDELSSRLPSLAPGAPH